MPSQQKLPSYAFLSPERAQRQAAQTQKGVFSLVPSECSWRDRHDHLKRHGYHLRPRYSPDWKPSWNNTNIDVDFCEDSILSRHPYILDATRKKDGVLVAIKTVSKTDHEIEIGLFLSSVQDPRNHCVPVLEILDDPLDPQGALMVMQYLRKFNDPEFVAVGEVIDFISQMLEGLVFLHTQHIAHRYYHSFLTLPTYLKLKVRDIAPPNVMMDGRPLYPHGHHPSRIRYSLDVVEEVVPLSRLDHPVRYYYVDFGLSVRFLPGASHDVVGDVGRDAEVPELSSTVPYDGFKADIYALGNMFDKEFVQKYLYLEPLQSLVDAMKQHDPQSRPTADKLLVQFEQIRSSLNASLYRWRLAPKSEPTYERVFNDTVAVAREGLSQLRKLVR